MQVDHINNNTIRVRIGKQELANRGLKVLDLLGDKNKIQHFFYSILDEIDTDHSFSQDAPVTFQVMPNNGGLDLLITKVTEKDRNNLAQLFDNDFIDNHKKNNDARKSFLDLEPEDEETDKDDSNEPADSSQPKVKKQFWKLQKKQAYSFTDLDQVTELADSLKANDLSSSLYFERGKFYLELIFTSQDYAEIKPANAWAIANEYGIKVKTSEMARVRTNGKCLLTNDALDQLRHYFSGIK
ncbi:adaptor protein MecA [Lactobacillus sp. M0398]|uniref:adaptor protein MecA n=1 Tax=unclassified Lactobacillus TaxID=2620435 RepID=UPI0018DDDC37|nr:MULTISPECIES: adaptor protein MecA [unclassified Lactobacillus]MBI0121434.1 adaptor protein MecA [Lactobacillus sp. M0398]MBI0123581.1 adaptor protein MecA [Lactobacillus sp. W8174]MBI0135789.1 adaptor protein MecA [Lactobacillus sp. W8173]